MVPPSIYRIRKREDRSIPTNVGYNNFFSSNQTLFQDDSFHLQLRNEIWLIALNRSVKYEGYQGYVVHNALFRLVYPTMADPRGISMLDSVQKIFDVCNLDLDDVETQIEQFKIDDGRTKYYKAPENSRTLKQGKILKRLLT